MNTQKEMYGQTERQVIDAWLEVRPFYRKNPELYIAAVLSDAQHMLSMGDFDRANKYINKAKLLLFKKIK
jgi:malic enzyme